MLSQAVLTGFADVGGWEGGGGWSGKRYLKSGGRVCLVHVREFTPETQDHLFLGIWGAGAPGSLVLGRLRVPAPPPRTSGIGVLGVAPPKTYRICDPGGFPPRPRREYVILGSSRPPDTPEWVISGDSRPPRPPRTSVPGAPALQTPNTRSWVSSGLHPQLELEWSVVFPLDSLCRGRTSIPSPASQAEQESPVRRRRPK